MAAWWEPAPFLAFRPQRSHKLLATANNCKGLRPQRDRAGVRRGAAGPEPQIACVLLLL